MRILFVHQKLGNFSGAEQNILTTAAELARRGHKLGLLHQERTGRNEAAWADCFPDTWCLPGERPPDNFVQQVLGRFGPDLVYFHSLPGTEVLRSTLNSGLPVVRMVHDHDLYCMRSYKYNVFTRGICARPASLYCVFPCLGCVVRNREGALPVRWARYRAKLRELELNRACRAWVVYSQYCRLELARNGFDLSRILVHVPLRRPAGPVGTSHLSSRNRILYAGQITRGKGVDLLLRALAKIGVPWECVILGEGHYQARCERLSLRLGLAGRVHFVGYVSPDEMRRHYLEASVMAVPSAWPEPFGMAGPEAMQFGLPVVAFDVGGIREWLHDGVNGLLVPPADVERFAQALQRVLADKDAARAMGRRGREGIAIYDPGRQVPRLEQLFLDVAAGVEAGPKAGLLSRAAPALELNPVQP